MQATTFIRLTLGVACIATMIPAGAGVAQDVIYFDDAAAASRYPVPQPQPQPSARRVGRSFSAVRIPTGTPMPGSMSREQAAQAFRQQAAQNQEKESSGNPFGKLASGFKGLFSRDESKQTETNSPQQPPRGLLQAGFAGPSTPPAAAARQGATPMSRRNNSGINLRQGDQRQGLFDLAFGSDDAAAAPRQTASRGATLKPTARANQNMLAERSPNRGSTLKARQRAASAGPMALPQLSGSPLPAMRQPTPIQPTPRMPMATTPQPLRQAPLASMAVVSDDPSDSIVMVSDSEDETSEPMAVIASVESDTAVVTDDQPLIVSDQPEPRADASEQEPSAPLPVVTTPHPQPQPLIVENPKMNEPAPVAIVTRAPSAPQRTAAAPKPAQKRVAKVAVLPNPVEVAESKPRQPSARAAALLAEAHYLAQEAGSEEDYTRVVQQCRHVLAIDDSDVAVDYSNQLTSWALNKRGELKADLGMVKEAMTDFDEAVSKDAGQWRAIHNRGVLMAQAGDFAHAFDAFNKTIELNPEFAKAHSNRASLYVQAGEFETALSDYKRAISLDPDLVIAHKGRGRVCHVLGRLEEALQHFEAAALLSPDDAGIATCRADLLVDMGRYAQAANGYLRAIEIDAQDPIAHRNLAWLQATCPDRSYLDGERALANAKRAIELSGNEDDICLDTLAAAQATSGDYEAAVETIKQAIALAPSSDQDEYAQRLELYQQQKPFRSQPAGVQQASYASDPDAERR